MPAPRTGRYDQRTLFAMPARERNMDWLNRQDTVRKRLAYWREITTLDPDETLPESNIAGSDALLLERVKKAGCFLPVRGNQYLERVLATQLGEFACAPSPSSPLNTDLDILDWTRTDYARIQRELKGLPEPRFSDQNYPEWLNRTQAARYLGITTSTLRAWIKQRRIPAAAIQDNRIQRDALSHLLTDTYIR